MSEKQDDIQIRKVKMLGDRARAEAQRQGLDENDLVVVKTKIQKGSLPRYEIEKIEGSPIEYIQKMVRA